MSEPRIDFGFLSSVADGRPLVHATTARRKVCLRPAREVGYARKARTTHRRHQQRVDPAAWPQSQRQDPTLLRHVYAKSDIGLDLACQLAAKPNNMPGFSKEVQSREIADKEGTDNLLLLDDLPSYQRIETS